MRQMTTQMLSVNEIHVLSKLEDGHSLLWITGALGYHDTEYTVSVEEALLRIFKGRILRSNKLSEIQRWHKNPSIFRAFRGRVFQ